MLIANDLESNAIRVMRLRGVRALPTEKNLGFQPYVKVTSTRSNIRARVGNQRLVLLAEYDVTLHFSSYRKRGTNPHAEVKMELEKGFLIDAAVGLDRAMTLGSHLMRDEIDYPVEFLCSAMEAVIAARSELIISADEAGFIDVELICKLPQETRKAHRLRALPRMRTLVDPEELKSFFRLKSTRRKKSK